jgi:hypothetical protein
MRSTFFLISFTSLLDIAHPLFFFHNTPLRKLGPFPFSGENMVGFPNLVGPFDIAQT